MQSIPKTEERQLTYRKDGKPLYIITRVIKSGIYKLYQCTENGYLLLKTRRNNPLFKEVGNGR